MDYTAFVRPAIAGLAPYTPMTYYETLARRLGRMPEEIVKLDANENPFGPSPAALEALASLRTLHRYPDPRTRALRQALAERTGVPLDQLFVGAGSDELLALTARLLLDPGDVVVVAPPTFSMYAFNAELQGARVVSVPRRPDFSLDLEALEATVARESPKILFACSPNNPTGNLISDADLERLSALPLFVVLDEAYVEFSGTRSRIQWAVERENLIVLRTFSKWAALAGLRVGYGAFPSALAPHLWKIKEPYTVSVAAQAAALATLQDPEYLSTCYERIIAERKRLLALLERLPYLHPYPSWANFVLVRVVERDPVALREALEAEGILLRFYEGQRLVRIGGGRPEQTDALMEVLWRI